VDVGEMQKKLSQWATADPTKRFVDLYSLLCNETWLRAATHATLRNKGSETAGIDSMTKSNFLVHFPRSICAIEDSMVRSSNATPSLYSTLDR
jgi:retron-type reverse transcriptase